MRERSLIMSVFLEKKKIREEDNLPLLLLLKDV
nr:MAG TPA: hypothetical protein [Caudoviricetes sp.]